MRAAEGSGAQRGGEMNPVIWFVVGGLLGWLTCMELDPRNTGGRVANVLAGACGALVVGLLLTSELGLDAVHSGEFSLESLVEAAFGGIVLLVLANLICFV